VLEDKIPGSEGDVEDRDVGETGQNPDIDEEAEPHAEVADTFVG
jgi:hypothetical protein